MRRMTYFVMALALVLGLAQCKKETIESQGEKVRITLNVDGGENNGTRANVTPPSVSFVNDDQILVASNGHYVGTLTASQSGDNVTFSGDITDPVEGKPLYFYFLGNEQGTLEAGATTCTVNISDQTKTNNKPVISMGKSTEDYASGTTSYTSRLYNKASLMKFNVTTSSTAAISILGMNNLVTVDFGKYEENGDGLGNGTNNGFSYSMDTQDGGLITMPAKNSEGITWAIVLPKGELDEGNEGTAYTEDGIYVGKRPAIHAIDPNKYYHEGDDVISMTLTDVTLLGTPLTFEAKTAGAKVKFTRYQYSEIGQTLEYSLDGGSTWQTCPNGEWISLASAGDKISFRGNNAHCEACKFSCDAPCYVYGNVMSLLSANSFATINTLTEDNAFESLFEDNENLYSHPDKDLLLPATTLTKGCYGSMFEDCTNLERAPELPATVLAEKCYQYMFQDCENLITAPTILPATTMERYCCYEMFSGCESLIKAPEIRATTMAYECFAYMFYGCASMTTPPSILPATTMAEDCCYNMFAECTSLETAPQLPATELAVGCYSNMFNTCESLITAPNLPATSLAESCYYRMFLDCENLVNVPTQLPATTLAESCYEDMFSGCTNLTTAPELPATELVDDCYSGMFEGCSSLNSITCLANYDTEHPSWYTSYWVDGVASTGTFTAATDATWLPGVNGIPSGWTRKNPDGSPWVEPIPAHEYVDLGLPSRLLWATCNVGADTPEGYGDYFAWGETTPKDTYTSNNYTYSGNPTILPSDHDAATAKWGSDWRMPTKAEWRELLDNTTVTSTTQNGVNGRTFTASNGNSIFLPAAGYYVNSLNHPGIMGEYWSSSPGSGNSAYRLRFDPEETMVDFNVRTSGRSVRAVRSPMQN